MQRVQALRGIDKNMEIQKSTYGNLIVVIMLKKEESFGIQRSLCAKEIIHPY